MTDRGNTDHVVRLETLHDDLELRMAELAIDRGPVELSRAIVNKALADGGTYYGINTGFGALATQRISDAELTDLQHNLLMSHAVGMGRPVPREITRLMLQLKIHALGLGYSGVSLTTFDRLIDFVKNDLVPVVPSKGSVGASGDLAPLAHMTLPLIGLGHFWADNGGEPVPAIDGLRQHGLDPITLSAKDGLALINGTQLMLGYGAFILEQTISLQRTADLIAAMSLEALQGSIHPFDIRIQAVRPHPGQAASAQNVRALLRNSEILESHRECGKVQDPYCLRCVPQVHGASRDALDYSRGVIETEINSATDNPLVFEDGDIISGGNFHGQPLAIALDVAAIALAELGSISERRTYLLLEGHDGLPRLLMHNTGINSGFMIPQYTAAALVSENKILCHPASVDSIPTSLGQEDHVSMGSISALKLLDVFENVRRVLSIELFTAAQALDFRRPLRPGQGIELAHEFIRSAVPHREADNLLHTDLSASLGMIRDATLIAHVGSQVDLV
jgi:histidine ammonia-lyase